MEYSGTVAKVTRRRETYGCVHVAVTITRDGANDVRLKYLEDFCPKVKRGQKVTITGMPMVGFAKVNVGAANVTIHGE